MPETRFWHPFANMAEVRNSSLTIARAEGCYVWDTDGNRYLDGTASLWYVNAGHGRTEIIEAIHRQAAMLDAYSTFGDYTNEPAEQLAARLAAVAPVKEAKVFFGSGGGDAIETAVKLARRHFIVEGAPDRVHIVTRVGGYHGTHGFGTSMAGIEPNHSGFGPLVPGHSTVPWDSVEALAAEFDRVGAERVAAFFCEPVVGAGGVYPPPPGYLESAAALCKEAGVLFVADSVICGFGRIGGWYGVERFGVEPDLITFAKGVTSGYQPLGGVIVSGDVSRHFWEGDGEVFRHGATYAGHPVCCAAGLANMDLLEREGLVGRGQEMEQVLLDALLPLADHHFVKEVRGGVGLLAAVELSPALMSERPSAVRDLQLAVRELGVLVRPLASAVAVSPPLVVGQEEIEAISLAISKGLASLG